MVSHVNVFFKVIIGILKETEWRPNVIYIREHAWRTFHFTYDCVHVIVDFSTNHTSRCFSLFQPLYRDAWDKEKANVNVPADTPLML